MTVVSEEPPISLSVVVPAHNEAARIRGPLQRVLAFLSAREAPSELIVVDDGSEDETCAVVQAVASEFAVPCQIASYRPRGGKGYALKVGFARARGERILFTDADLSTPIEDAAALLARLDEGFDVAIGSRKVPGARLETRQPWYREGLGRVFTWLVQVLIAPVSDATCGFKAYQGDVGRELFERLRIYDWSFDAELLFIARKRGYRIAELPVTWNDVAGTNVRLLRDVASSLVGLARIRLHGAMGLHATSHDAAARLEVWRSPGSSG